MYERNRDSYTMREQLKLSQSKVAVVGVGGGGCVVSELLARVGVGYIRLIDGDVFESSNANRQIGCTSDTIGQNKPIVMRERLMSINPYIKVDAIPEFLTVDNYKDLLQGVDIVSDTADGRKNKFLISDCCKELNLPYVSGGLGNTNFWTATFTDQNFSTRDVLKNDVKSLFANSPDVFIQGGFQAQEIINFLLNRNWGMQNKILSVNHNTYTMTVRDI